MIWDRMLCQGRTSNPQRVELTNDAAERTGSGRVETFGHAAGEPGFTAGGDGFAHRFRHKDRVGSFGDGGVHEYAISTQFHRDGGIGGDAHACIDNHGDFGDAFAEDAQVGGILNAEAGTNGSGKRHDGGGAYVDEFAGGDEIVIRVGENDKTFFYEDARGFDELLGIGEKSLLIADDFQLDPVG